MRLHLETLSANFNTGTGSSVTIFDIKDYVLSLLAYERPLISELVTILKLILVLPSTNAMSERSFSALRRIKNYLRSTMLQSRLNHLLLLHVHKDLTDSLDLVSVTNDFTGNSEHRQSYFGKFTIEDTIPDMHCRQCMELYFVKFVQKIKLLAN